MWQNGKRPLENEFHSSQLYRILKGSGIPAADKLTRGLDKAAREIDGVIAGVSSAGTSSGQPGGTGWQGTGPAQTTQTRETTPPGEPTPSGYAYRYTYGGGSGGYPQQRGNATQSAGYAGPVGTPGPKPNTPPNPGNRRPAGVNPVPPPSMPPMKMVRRGSPAKFYITGAAALAYALSAPMSEPLHFVTFGIVMVLVFLLSGAIFKGKKEFVPVEPEKPVEEKPEPPKEEKSSTGNPEVDKLIDEGNEALKKLRKANDAIPDQALSECIERMERASADIFRFIGEHPEKAPQIRKFMNYYLPTTLKLLNSYQRLSSQSVKGENITSTMFNIAGMMHTVADAFEKQLDALFSDEAMDISADITVFESILKQEGFTDREKKEL